MNAAEKYQKTEKLVEQGLTIGQAIKKVHFNASTFYAQRRKAKGLQAYPTRTKSIETTEPILQYKKNVVLTGYVFKGDPDQVIDAMQRIGS